MRWSHSHYIRYNEKDNNDQSNPESLSTDERENILNNIIPIHNTDDTGCKKHEIQNLYTYMNKIYCDLHEKVEENECILTELRGTHGNRFTEIENKVVSISSTVNGRLLVIEDNVMEIQKSIKAINKSKIDKVMAEELVVKRPVDSWDKKIRSLKEEIKTNLELANFQFNHFVLFKEDFDKNVTSTLDRVNNDYKEENIVRHNDNHASDSTQANDNLSREVNLRADNNLENNNKVAHSPKLSGEIQIQSK